MKLTLKERIKYAMNLQTPDKIPLMCQFSFGSMMHQLQPDPVEFWYDKNVFAEGLIELCKKFKFDGILVSLHGHYDNWKDKLVKSEQIGNENIKLTFENRTEVHSLTDLPLIIFNEIQIAPDIEEIDERDTNPFMVM